MKHLRVRAGVDADAAPKFFNLLANSPHVREARVVEWNTTLEEADTVLLAIDGDPEPFRASATDTPGIQSVELSAIDRDRTYALVETQPLSTPMFDRIHEARTRAGLVVRKPIIYREGEIRFRVVGDPEPLQTALERAGDVIDVKIEEIGRFRGDAERPRATLSERQCEAVETALELDYYDRPRGATHHDIAEKLDCAPATVSGHLQKAEAKLVRAAMDEFGPGV